VTVGRHALLHDYLLVPGGAEQFALHVATRLEGMDPIAGFIDSRSFPPEDPAVQRFRSLVSPSRIRGWQGIKAIWAFRARCGFLSDYETVLYSGMYSPLAVTQHQRGRNIYYCHTPPRFVYDLREYYREHAGPLQRPFLDALARYLKPRYEEAVSCMDVVIANSNNVRKRLETCLGLSGVHVIHPPVRTDRFAWIEQGDYFLSTARLEPYKRVDLVVRAFMRMPEQQLVVTSGGSQYETLRRMAQGCDNIRFTGWCGEEDLSTLIGRCRATVYLPIDEDFGISPIESMAAGKPVIGVAEGGLLESVVSGETGMLLAPACLPRSTPSDDSEGIDAIVRAVLALDETRSLDMRAACIERARQFSCEVFDERMAALLRS